jgi:transcriptional regulator with PAS, ATPase and Fis domain
MQKIYQIIDSVANTNATILITGESGTGKGLVAKAIHENDPNRKNNPFVEVSCGALSETLLESELFGHIKGAFTGAIKDKEGRFELAKGGTIFLDEIDVFSPALQVKLLRVLQDGVFERVGDTRTRKTDARIIVATNQDLTDLVAKGQFREDLYYRINVISIKLPPLRERNGDINLLVKHFVEFYNQNNNKKITDISDEVRNLFLLYQWPGNIRELENAIEGAVIMTKGTTINKWDIPCFSKFSSPVATISPSNGKSLKQVLEQPERNLILSILEECNWNRNKAAKKLGINRTTLYNKMKKYHFSSMHSKKYDSRVIPTVISKLNQQR